MEISSSAWTKLQDRYYRQREMYKMKWRDVDLGKMVVAAAPYGGPIAMIRDESKIVRVGAANLRPMLTIFTANGIQLASVPIPWKEGRVAKLFWADTEELVCVLEEGAVYFYSLFGEVVASENLFPGSLRDEVVRDCAHWGDGFVALTSKNRLILIDDYDNFRPVRFAELPFTSRPHCMAVIPPPFCADGGPNVLIAVDRTIFVVTPTNFVDQSLTNGPFVRMSICGDGKLLATYTSDGHVWVTVTDFTKNLSDFHAKSRTPPLQLVWCGVDSVVLYWERMLLMVGPHGDWAKYGYDDSLVLCSEIDGVRVISREKSDFIARVPDSTVEIFKIGSCEPGAVLFDAADLFKRQDAKADENMRSLRGRLEAAVESCIDAAMHEFDEGIQEQLLNAAAHGLCYCPPPSSSIASHLGGFHGSCRTLRVMNALRDENVGIAITFAQFERLTAPVVIDRLVSRHMHLFALRLASFLHLPTNNILIHWGCQKVKDTTLTEQQVVNAIRTCFAPYPSTPYRHIARTAAKTKRLALAKMLIEFEPNPADQVSLFIEMQDAQGALQKAIQSGDTDLVYLALFHLASKASPSLSAPTPSPLLPPFPPSLLRAINAHQTARDLLVSYLLQIDPKSALGVMEEATHATDMAMILARNSYRSSTFEEWMLEMNSAKRTFAQSSNKEAREFYVKATEEEVKLGEFQRELETAHPGQSFMHLSLSDTLFKCVAIGQSAKAVKIKNYFKVADKRWWWINIRGLGARGAWGELETFSREKTKPPCGFEPFAEICIQYREIGDALKYIPKVADATRRADLFKKIGRYREAAEAAVSAKDLDMLMTIRTAAKDPNIEGFIDQLISSHGLR